jgi:hypothetical protein
VDRNQARTEALRGRKGHVKPDLRFAARSTASRRLPSVGGARSMLGQHRDNDIARVEQHGFLLVRRNLDKARALISAADPAEQPPRRRQGRTDSIAGRVPFEIVLRLIRGLI